MAYRSGIAAGPCLAIVAVFLVIECSRAWRVDYVPNRKISVLDDSDVVRFHGDSSISSSPDFSSVLIDGDALFVGAKNVFYNLNARTLSPVKTLPWPVADGASNNCLNGFQKTTVECQNYIRVLAPWQKGEVLICGTNAMQPSCRIYKNSAHYDVLSSRSGAAICPYGPNDLHSYTVVDQTIFSATFTDMVSTDPVIFNGKLRTERYLWFQEPKFVSSFAYDDKVYFLFREMALEHENVGKIFYSRIARVCKNDKGGRTILQDKFTSFLKTRLNCSIPGDVEFSFDEIVDASSVGRGNIGPTQHARSAQDMIYGLFNTPENSISGGAVCAFRLSDVISSFRSRFLSQPKPGSYWKPLERPAADIDECAEDSKTTPDNRLDFLRRHTLMEQPVPSFGGRPLYVQTHLSSRMKKLAVDWQVPAADGRYYDILFIGTDDGHVMKVYNPSKSTAVTVEEIKVADSEILDLKIHGGGQGGNRLIITAKDQIISLPLHRCGEMKSCGDCVALRDPYCSWNPNQNVCGNSRTGYQNLATGKHVQCPTVVTDSATEPKTSTPSEDCGKCSKCSQNQGTTNQIPNEPKGKSDDKKIIAVGDPKNNTLNNLPAFGASRENPDKPDVSIITLVVTLVISSIIVAGIFSFIGYKIGCRKTKDQSSNLKYLEKHSDMDSTNRANSNIMPLTPTKNNVYVKQMPAKTTNKYVIPSPVPEHKIPVGEHNNGTLPSSPPKKAYV